MPIQVATALMYEGNAEMAMQLYVSVFSGSEIIHVERYRAGEAGREGSIKKAEFLLSGHRVFCMDSPISHGFTFTPSISLWADCVDKAEFDLAVTTLSAEGDFLMEPADYGFSTEFAWLKDRFGVSWQINLP